MAGNLIVGQSGGCTAAINATLAGVLDEALAQPAVSAIYGMQNGIQGLLDGDVLDLRGQPAEELALLRDTPSAALGSCRFKADEDGLERLLATLSRLDVRYFLYIGGNDSADTSDRLDRLARS